MNAADFSVDPRTLELLKFEVLAPLGRILKNSGSSMIANPVFWTRIVGYAYLCQQFIATQGNEMGFTDRTLDVNHLVALTHDLEIMKHSAEQEDIFSKVIAEGL